MDEVLKYFHDNEVICKKVEDNREEYGDFIAIFGYGRLTRNQIVECVKENNLFCMFFEGAIREKEWKKNHSLGS
jgi:hypothetical protein